jgi:hypothetical protein
MSKGKFVKGALPPAPVRSDESPTTASATPPGEPKRNFYRDSWALIIGINDYEHWPKLRYAVNDADGIEEVLTGKFGFKKENIRKLLNGDATRQRIMQCWATSSLTATRCSVRIVSSFSSPATALRARSKTAGRWDSSCRWMPIRTITSPPPSAWRRSARRPT